MTRIVRKIFYAMLSFVLSFLVVMAGLFPAILPASAEQTSKSVYEQTNVLDDLKKSTIGDQPFDLSTYNFDESKETKVLSFVEIAKENFKVFFFIVPLDISSTCFTSTFTAGSAKMISSPTAEATIINQVLLSSAPKL